MFEADQNQYEIADNKNINMVSITDSNQGMIENSNNYNSICVSKL